MTKFVSEESAKTRKEAFEIVGRDWAKVVKVCGGWAFFDTIDAWKTWKNQK